MSGVPANFQVSIRKISFPIEDVTLKTDFHFRFICLPGGYELWFS